MCEPIGREGFLEDTQYRNMERAGIPRKVAMSISGHKTEAIYRGYDIVRPQDLKIAAAKMENCLDGCAPVATILLLPNHPSKNGELQKVN